MMRVEVTAWQLLLVVSLIRKPHHQSWRRMIDSVAPSQERQEAHRGPVEGRAQPAHVNKVISVRRLGCCGVLSCKLGGVSATVQMGGWIF